LAQEAHREEQKRVAIRNSEKRGSLSLNGKSKNTDRFHCAMDEGTEDLYKTRAPPPMEEDLEFDIGEDQNTRKRPWERRRGTPWSGGTVASGSGLF